MTVHNALKRYTALLRAHRLAMGEDQEVALERLSETLQPTFNIFQQPEWAALRGEFLCAAADFAGASPGNFPIGALWPPDGMIAVVERLQVRASNAGQFIVGVDARQATTPSGLKYFKDNRKGAAVPRTTLAFETTAAIASPGTYEAHDIDALTLVDVPGPWVIVGGGLSLCWAFDVVNTVFLVNYFWRERQLLPGESAL